MALFLEAALETDIRRAVELGFVWGATVQPARIILRPRWSYCRHWANIPYRGKSLTGFSAERHSLAEV